MNTKNTLIVAALLAMTALAVAPSVSAVGPELCALESGAMTTDATSNYQRELNEGSSGDYDTYTLNYTVSGVGGAALYLVSCTTTYVSSTTQS